MVDEDKKERYKDYLDLEIKILENKRGKRYGRMEEREKTFAQFLEDLEEPYGK